MALENQISIVTIHGDYDVLIGNHWMRGFDRRWKAKLYAAWLGWTRKTTAVDVAKEE